MKTHTDPVRDLAEIRSLMERSSTFRALSGWQGVLAGAFASVGAGFAAWGLEFAPQAWAYALPAEAVRALGLTALAVLVPAAVTALAFSRRKAAELGEPAWNPTTRRLLAGMAVPMASGGLLCVLGAVNGLLGLIPALMLLFYASALFHAARFTIPAVRTLAYVQTAFGWAAALFPEYGLLCWALGFGAGHLVYGITFLMREAR